MARVEVGVRSGPSRKICYLRFVNRTSRTVNVIWIDYNGASSICGTLEPDRHFDIHTYEGHPWVCEDSITQNRMLLNKLKIFYASVDDRLARPAREIRCYLPVLSNSELIRTGVRRWKREYVYITVPVFPLVELSAETVVKNVRSGEDIGRLKIPTRLQTLLQSYYFHP